MLLILFYKVESFSGKRFDKKATGWAPLARAATLCNDAQFKAGQGDVPIAKRYCINQ